MMDTPRISGAQGGWSSNHPGIFSHASPFWQRPKTGPKFLSGKRWRYNCLWLLCFGFCMLTDRSEGREALENLRRAKGIPQEKLLGGERYWRKIITRQRNPSRATLIGILTGERNGLRIRDIPTINYFLALWNFAPLIENEIQAYKLADSTEATHSAAELVAHYPLYSNPCDESEYHNEAREVRVKYGVQDGRRGAILDGKASCILTRHAPPLCLDQFALCAWVRPNTI